MTTHEPRRFKVESYYASAGYAIPRQISSKHLIINRLSDKKRACTRTFKNVSPVLFMACNVRLMALAGPPWTEPSASPGNGVRRPGTIGRRTRPLLHRHRHIRLTRHVPDLHRHRNVARAD